MTKTNLSIFFAFVFTISIQQQLISMGNFTTHELTLTPTLITSLETATTHLPNKNIVQSLTNTPQTHKMLISLTKIPLYTILPFATMYCISGAIFHTIDQILADSTDEIWVGPYRDNNKFVQYSSSLAIGSFSLTATALLYYFTKNISMLPTYSALAAGCIFTAAAAADASIQSLILRGRGMLPINETLSPRINPAPQFHQG